MSSSGSSTKTLNVTMFPFLMMSSGAQLGVNGTVVACWVLFYFGAVVEPRVFGDVMLFMYLIDVASVSQLCYLPFIVIYITCDVVKIA